MHDPTLRAVPKGLIADEVWALVQDHSLAAIPGAFTEGIPQLGGFAPAIVQDPARSRHAGPVRVILVNTATKVVLPRTGRVQDEIATLRSPERARA